MNHEDENEYNNLDNDNNLDNNNPSTLRDDLEMSNSGKFRHFEKNQEFGFLERIYDDGQGGKFNDLIKNPAKIQAIKAFITDEMDNINDIPKEETKEKGEEDRDKPQGNIQELLSRTSFKVIDKLPPTGGETTTSANKMIERFRKTGGDSKAFSDTNYSKRPQSDFEPKLSRPTTTIINLEEKFKAPKKDLKNKGDAMNVPEEEEKKADVMDPLTGTNDIDENDQDEYMNKIHKFIRDAFENRDHKMDFVYYLPSDKENYYDLRAKEFKAISNAKTYYTLSSKGLTVYIDKKPKEFIKLAEWINERQRYNVIAEIPFFKHFKIWRILKMWRKNIFKQKKIAYQNELQSSLLFNNNDYNDKLIRHKSYSNTILKTLKIVDMKVGLDSNSFQKFQDQQSELRKKVRKELDKVHAECQAIFDNSIKTIFSQVQQKINDLHNEENHNTDDNKKGKGGNKSKKKDNQALQQYQDEQYDRNNDQKGILNEDEIVGFDNFSYKNKMMIKDECKNFVKLAYLFDYIMLDILRRMFLDSMTEVIGKLKKYNEIVPPKPKENIMNKKGDYIKAQVQNQNRTVPYFLIQCKLDNAKNIVKNDIKKETRKRFFVKSTPDEEFDPCAHIMIDSEEMEYQKLLLEGKNPQDIINSGMAAGMNSDDIPIEILKQPHHYFISFSPDNETLKTKFEAEINETLGELKVKGWKAHPRFSHYLKYMDDWDEKFGEWDTEEARDLNVEMILKEDPEFTTKESQIEDLLRQAFKNCNEYLQNLNEYLQLHWKQKSIKKEILLDEYLKDSDEIMRLVFVFSEKSKKTLERYIPYEEDVGMIKLSLEENLRKELRNAQNSTIAFLKEHYPDKLKSRAFEIENWFNDMLKKIDGPIADESAFLQKTKAKEILDIWYDINERKLNSLVAIALLLRIKGFDKISAEDVKQIENINAKKYELKLKWDSLNENLSRNQEKMYQNLHQSSIPQLLKETSRIEEPLRDPKFVTYDPAQDKLLIPSYVSELEDLEKKFGEIESKANTYNDFLKVLQQPEYNFDKVDNVKELLMTLKQLWRALKEFDEDCETWKKKDFKTIDTKAILTKCDDYLIIAKKAEINVSEKGTAIQVLMSTVNNFIESMRVIDYLNCENLKESHWLKIQELFPDCQQKLGDKDYQLDFLLINKAYEHEDAIRKIQLQAINYDRLHNQIREIIEMKKEIILKVNLEKKIIEEFPKLIEAIEICQSNINNVLSSRYAALFKNEKLNNPFDLKVEFETVLFLIEKTKMFQKKFKYIENIINSGDMKRKLQDGNFDKIDVDWKKMLTIVANSNVNKLRSYGDMIIKAIDDLEKIQKKIEEQLKIMRNEFERFYFISNDDLLFMLANSKSSDNKSGKDGIEMIKPYLCKLFEDIYDLKLIKNEQGINKVISSIVSLSKEELEFQKLKQVKIEDDLESWLKKLESNIFDSLKERTMQMYKYYEDIKDPNKHKIWLEKIELEGKESDGKENKTIIKNLSQIIATVSHIMFVENTENAIKGLAKEQNSLVDWYRKIDQAILSYSQLVNEDTANNNRNLRRIISNLITHHVHYKDIMAELIEVEPGISDFEWQKQLRTYFVNADPNNRYETNFIAKIRQLKYEFEYGYEYFGPSVRVVITPLTDRVWLTMSSGLQIKLGCSLGGPAGTGKTETTKDLAKFFGIQCIVFNCSEQIDYRILGNIFSGLCKHKTGAFACLDEFNRINVEVLSVIATQLFKIRQAMLTGDKMVTIMTDPLNLVGRSGVFVTMNPTYSGRTELPDNLKANFRPITMMKPEFSKIAQVKLYSEGFSGSDILSKKLYKLYELAEQQLSQQDHYDFTLRTLGTVLSMAGSLKRKTKSVFGNERKDEELIVMSALRDANFPKFVAEDIKLFKALLSDLFPDVICEEDKVENFETELTKVIEEDRLDACPFTLKKCIQLVDIVNIRLGVCLTGPPGTGKTTVIDLVEKVCTKMFAENPQCDPKYKNIKKWTINPKSITMGELFGEENEEKKIFEYGIATKKIKKALNDEGEDRYRWVVFDGPIDTKWIENMNSVLDDSQTLCLANGERIKLKSHVKVLFEVEDLSKASLATVSRLGVIYLGPKELGWRPYSHYWMKTYFHDESIFPNELQLYLGQLFEDKVDDAIDNIDDLEKSGCLFVKPVISSLITSLCHLLEFYFTRENGFIGKELQGIENQEQLGRYKRSVVQAFAMSMVWGVFGCVNNKGSARVESFIRNKFGEIKMENSQIIMEHYFDFNKNDYIKFEVDANAFVYEKGMSYNTIFVPTIDTMRYSFILNILLGARRNVFVTGETGTGKTAIINHLIKNMIDSEEWTTITMNFSAQTSSEETQRSLESKLEQKKGKKLLWGKGGKKCLIFIDDINMPEPNEWGAHPPIELLRQYLDKGGLYDRPGFFWKQITNTNIIVAGGPPIGGRSNLTGRYMRHMTTICFPQPGKQVLNNIFESILKGFFTVNIFNENIKKLTIETTSSTIEIYDIILSSMKPIPSKFHYIFNLRDISRVFQGLLMINSKSFNSSDSYIKLWIHEVLRVFCDRLNNAEDLKSVQDNIALLARNKFKMQWTYDSLFKSGPPIYFGEMHKGDVPNRPYEEILDMESLVKKLNLFVQVYNKDNKATPLQVVFFDYFLMHIIRVCRVLRQPKGSMVLIGHGGSGKQTVCVLSCYIMKNKYMSFNAPRDYRLRDFRNDIKDIIEEAGAKKHQTVIALNDNNVGHNFILEDINNLLNNGEIPNLFENEVHKFDMTYDQFVENTKNNLHILFATSPVGDNLRLRMRKFPALINCCLLNWFMAWPTEALISCCQKKFQMLPYENEAKENLVKLVTAAHCEIEALRDNYFNEFQRKVYITPKSFLDMIEMFVNLLKQKKEESDKKINVLDEGTKKLKKTHEDIIKLEDEIRKLEPIIKEKAIALEKYMEEINKKRVEVEKQKAEVDYVSKQALTKQKEVKSLLMEIDLQKNECVMKFEKIKIAVKEKLSADTLAQFSKEKIINEYKKIIPKVFAMFLTGKNSGGVDKSYAYQVFEERNKIYKIEELIEKNSIPDHLFEDLKKDITETIPNGFSSYKQDMPNIEDKLLNLSATHQALYIWGKGILDLWEIDKKLRPLKEDAAKNQLEKEQLEAQVKELNRKREAQTKELDHLEAEMQKSQIEIDELQDKMRLNSARLENASKLLYLLKDEGVRWSEQLANLKLEAKNFLGNIILSSMFISYLSPFSGAYRQKQSNDWVALCRQFNVNVSSTFTLESVMSDPVQIRQWLMNGLPGDSVSKENAVMMKINSKYPLMIDPQLQANQWLKKMIKTKLSVWKADCKDEQMKSQFDGIGNDLIRGNQTLLENVSDQLDSIYNPIISQSFFDDGGGSFMINFNGRKLEFSPDFKMYFTTKLANPHYPPEMYIKLNILNFTVTQSGLTEQLLSEVFKSERREKYEQLDNIISEMGRMNDQLAEFSRDILQKLAEVSEDRILDDNDLISTLQDAKTVSDQVNISMASNILVEKETTIMKNEYTAVAVRGSILFFVVADMSKIDPMYQFSLEYFKKIFITSIGNKDENSADVKERVKYLERKITEDIYKNIKRGIFESHKTIFSLLINVNIKKALNLISDDEWAYFIKGPSTFDTNEMEENPDKKFFSESQWLNVLYTQFKMKHEGIAKAVIDNLDRIKEIYGTAMDFKAFDVIRDDIFKNVANGAHLLSTNFRRLSLVKLFKPERIQFFIKKLIQEELGELFVDTNPSRLEEIYEESDWRTPIIFILSKGADPTNEFLSFKNRFQAMKKEEYEANQALLLKQQQEMLTEMSNQEKEKAEGEEEAEAEAEGERDPHHQEEDEEEKERRLKEEEEKKEAAGKEGEGAEGEADPNQQGSSILEQPSNPGEFQTYIISLGQGQEQEARKAIREYGMKNGAWVLLQNCHLFASFMPDLATIVQSLQQEDETAGEINSNFRLWLTSMPVATFPVSILQNSLKLTTEPPSGIKSNMKKLFDDVTEDKLLPPPQKEDPNKEKETDPQAIEQAKKDAQTKRDNLLKILFSLSLFHSVLQERKKFGSIGFNIRYDFNQSDFDTSSQLINIYLNEADAEFIPWDSILYLIGEVTYGGSITDETDRIVMNSTLIKFINENLLTKEKDEKGNELETYLDISFGNYSIPTYKNIYEYQRYINTLPSFDDPEIFGLNMNANIVYELKESTGLVSLLTNILPRTKSSGRNTNEIVIETINNIVSEEIECIDKKQRHKIHDKLYDNDLQHSLTIVLFQEIDKYNNLIVQIDVTLKELKRAIEGLSLMSTESDEIFNSLLLNRIPYAWSKISYSSFKSLSSWITDLKERVKFITDWLINGHPHCYWISGLFYPQGFITGVYQNHARETRIPVSDIVIKFSVIAQAKEDLQRGPKAGIYVYGLFLEGAGWDEKTGLVDQKPGDMNVPMPLIWFETTKEAAKKYDEDDDGNEEEIFYYSCPMFKTRKRASVISSSGNSNEKVIEVELHSKENKDYWTLRGTALIMQQDD